MFKRAKILSYDAKKRTAQIHIPGLTDGASEGITATFAYPIGDDDRQTERQIIIGNDVFIFFENNNQEFPVIAHYSSHSNGALVDVRRIQQKNVEIIGEKEILLDAPTQVRLCGDPCPFVNPQKKLLTIFCTLIGAMLTVNNLKIR